MVGDKNGDKLYERANRVDIATGVGRCAFAVTRVGAGRWRTKRWWVMLGSNQRPAD